MRFFIIEGQVCFVNIVIMNFMFQPIRSAAKSAVRIVPER